MSSDQKTENPQTPSAMAPSEDNGSRQTVRPRSSSKPRGTQQLHYIVLTGQSDKTDHVQQVMRRVAKVSWTNLR